MSDPEPLVPLLQEWTHTFMHRSMHSLIHYLREKDLSFPQVGALAQIHRGRSNVSDIGQELGITTAAASQMVDRLVEQELVRRSEDPDDRRAKKLALTPKGCRVVQQSMQARMGWLEEVASSLSPKEREQVAAALRILTDKVAELDRQAVSAD